VGPPNSGKSTTMKNYLIGRGDKPYTRIILYNNDPNTKEYGHMNVEHHDNLEFLDDLKNTDPSVDNICVIFEDFDFYSVPKSKLHAVNNLFSYVCSHLYVTLFIVTQSIIGIPTTIRRKINFFCICNNNYNDAYLMHYVKKLSGLDNTQFNWLIKKYFSKQYDSITIALCSNVKFRYKIFEKIEL
jgi:hypothetical protein